MYPHPHVFVVTAVPCRFLLTQAALELNKDNNFKRLLASEKLEDEANKHTSSNKESEEKSNNSSNNNSKGSEKKSEKKSARGSKDQKSRTRTSESEHNVEMSPAKQKQSTLQVRSSMSPRKNSKRGGDLPLIRGGSQGEKASTSEQQSPETIEERPEEHQSDHQSEPRSFSTSVDRSSDQPLQLPQQSDRSFADPSPRQSEVLERNASVESV